MSIGIGSSNVGLLYELSEEIQNESQSRSKIAGPIPPSWFRENQRQRLAKARRHGQASADAAAATAASKNPQTSAGVYLDGDRSKYNPSYRPMTLKEECLWFFLRDIAGPCLVAGEVPYLPVHFKQGLVSLATRACPLDDLGVDLLLLDVEEDEEAGGGEEDDGNASDGLKPDARSGPNDAGNPVEETAEYWETNKDLLRDPPPERLITELDLSHSLATVPMLRRLFLAYPGALVRQTVTRLPRLRSLDLSRARHITLNASLLSILPSVSLTRLCLVGLPCTLYSPLESLAQAFPSLKHLDLSHSDWLQWNHLHAVDWGKQWQELQTLTISHCPDLKLTASYMNPEGRVTGPGVIMEAMGIIREKGRRKWLDVVA